MDIYSIPESTTKLGPCKTYDAFGGVHSHATLREAISACVSRNAGANITFDHRRWAVWYRNDDYGRQEWMICEE